MDNSETPQSPLVPLVQSLSGEIQHRDKSDQPTVTVPSSLQVSVMKELRDDQRFQIDFLLDQQAIDWLTQDRIELVYQLY